MSSASCDLFSPYSVSVRRRRVLVTCRISEQLLLYNDAGSRLARVKLPRFSEPRHAVETQHKTFVVCHVGRPKSDPTGALVTTITVTAVMGSS